MERVKKTLETRVFLHLRRFVFSRKHLTEGEETDVCVNNFYNYAKKNANLCLQIC